MQSDSAFGNGFVVDRGKYPPVHVLTEAGRKRCTLNEPEGSLPAAPPLCPKKEKRFGSGAIQAIGQVEQVRDEEDLHVCLDECPYDLASDF